MEIIIDEWTEKKYSNELLMLRALSAECLDNSNIAITKTLRSYTTMHTFKNNSLFKAVLNYTVELHVELSESAKNKALDVDIPLEKFKGECGKFFQEAEALRNIAEMKRPFGLKIICVSYLPPTR